MTFPSRVLVASVLLASYIAAATASPSVSSMSPTSCPPGSPLFNLTVNGSGFVSGALVQWNGATVPTTFVSSTQLTAQIGTYLTGSPITVPVFVWNPDGSLSNSLLFVVASGPIPSISSVSPATVDAGGASNISLTISGSNFVNGATVTWVDHYSVTPPPQNNVQVATQFVSSTQLIASMPASLYARSGNFILTVKNPDGGMSGPANWTVNPVLTSVSPTSVTVGQTGVVLQIAGAGFQPTESAVFTQGQTSVTLPTPFYNSTTLTASLDASLLGTAGPGSITVRDASGGLSSRAVSFTVNGPPLVLQSVAPNIVGAGAGDTLISLRGSGFVQGSVIYAGSTPLKTYYWGATLLDATFPATLALLSGKQLISVHNPDGAISNTLEFTVRATLTSVSPSSVMVGSPATAITAGGEGFIPGDTLAFVRANVSTPIQTAYVNSKSLTGTIPASALSTAGSAEIWVVDSAGVQQTYQPFNVLAAPIPSLTAISPSTVTVGGPAFTLSLTGSGFLSGATVTLGSTPLSTTFVSSTSLTAAVPAAAIATIGNLPVTVANPAGQASSPLILQVTPVPVVITSLSPASTLAGGPDLTLTVNGSGFVSGSIVWWKSTALSTIFVSSTQLTAQVPASAIASAGRYSVTVVNAGGASSNALTFTVSDGSPSGPPSIGSISPTQLNAGAGGATLSIAGANFVLGAIVSWGSTPLNTTFGSSTQLTASVPASLITLSGGFSITAKNPDGRQSNSVTELVNPVVVSFDPPTVPIGSPAFTLTVTGVGFVPSNYIKVANLPMATTYVNSTTLTTTVPPSITKYSTVFPIQVFDPSGATSNYLYTNTTPLTISSWAPATVSAGGPGFTLTINGQGFVPTTAVQWNGTALPVTIISTNQLTAQVSAPLIANAGDVSVTVNTSGSGNGFTFSVTSVGSTLAIASISPTQVNAGAGPWWIQVSGTGFTQKSVINWAGMPLTTTFLNSSLIQAVAPSNLLQVSGRFSITVSNPDGTTSAPFPIYVEPALQGVSGGMSSNGTAMLTAVGQGFVPSDIIEITVSGNTSRLPTTFVNATTLTAVIDAALLQSPTPFLVTVADPATGTAATAVNFQPAVTAPSISAVSPTTVASGGQDFTLTVTGSNFDAGTVVLWNGSRLATTLVNARQVTAVVPGALIATGGTANITAISAGGLVSNAVLFTVTSTLPSVTTAGIVNAASGLPMIAPGCLISIYGANLAASAAQATTLPLPTSLSGTTVLINGVPAPLLFVSPGQINAQVPVETEMAPARLVVRGPAGDSTPASFNVNPTAPGVMTLLLTGHALAVNLPGGSLNSAENAALPGQYIMVYITGQGQTTPPIATGAPAPASPFSVPYAQLQAKVGGKPAFVQFAGMAPGFVGLLQLNLLVPDVPGGDQPLEVTLGNASANSTVVSVRAQ